MNNLAENMDQSTIYSVIPVDLIKEISSFLELSSVEIFLQTTVGLKNGIHLRAAIQKGYLTNNFQYLAMQRESGDPEFLSDEDDLHNCSDERKIRIRSVRSNVQAWIEANKNWKFLYEESIEADFDDPVTIVNFVLGDVHWLSYIGLLEVVRYLVEERFYRTNKNSAHLENECCILDTGMHGRCSPLWVALLAPDKAVFEYLVARCEFSLKSGIFDGGNIIHDAAFCDKMRPECLLLLLESVRHLVNVNQKDQDGLTPLHILFRKQYKDPHLVAKIEHMLAAGLDLYTSDKRSITPMGDFIRLVRPPFAHDAAKLLRRYIRKRVHQHGGGRCNFKRRAFTSE